MAVATVGSIVTVGGAAFGSAETYLNTKGSLNGTVSKFEWIIQNKQVTHRMFIPGDEINGFLLCYE